MACSSSTSACGCSPEGFGDTTGTEVGIATGTIASTSPAAGSYTPRADEDRPKYSIVFSRGTVDLSQLAKNGEGAWAEVTVVFGNALVKVDPAVPREVEINTAFGEVHLPNQTTGNIGNYHYRPPGQTGEPRLHLKLNVVFGGCQVIEQG